MPIVCYVKPIGAPTSVAGLEGTYLKETGGKGSGKGRENRSGRRGEQEGEGGRGRKRKGGEGCPKNE